MKQYGPIPKTIQLANTLAQRVIQLRELRNMTVRDLSRSTRFGIRRVEDIQSGLETWLSSTDRQILAKALVVEPAIIEEVERRDPPLQSGQIESIPSAIMADLHEAILRGQHQLNCPLCGSKLNCSVQNGYDLEGRPVQLTKAHCTKCPFILK